MPFQLQVQDVTPQSDQEVSDTEDPEYDELNENSPNFDEELNFDEKLNFDNKTNFDIEEEEEEEESLEYNRPTVLQDIKLYIPGITLFYGKTNSGKSVLMKQLLYLHAKQFDQIYVFQGCVNDDWKCLPSRCVFVIKDQTDAQLKIIIEGASKLKKIGKHTLIIIDDPFNGSNNYHKSKIWEQLSTMSRHFLISIWMSVQNPGLIPPVLKGNITGCFVTKLADSHIKKIYEYTSGFAKVTELISFLNNNLALGKVFYNDLRKAFGGTPYTMVEVPYPSKKFVIRFK